MRTLATVAAAAALALLISPAHAGKRAGSSPFDLSPLETRVLGQTSWLSGGPAALRVIVTNHNTGKPITGTVTMSLAPSSAGKPDGAAIPLFSGVTGATGTVSTHFQAPQKPGSYQLAVHVAAPLGSDTVKQQIQVEEGVQALLTSDKPIYQPGQVMHLRLLAINRGTRSAVTGENATFEVEDARSNKVFKVHEPLSRFGVASADFQLADEVNMGTFTLRAILPETTAEKQVRVERYLLPKFKITLTTDKPYYLPGETLSGKLKATYFFGKPVADGNADIDISTPDIGTTEIKDVKTHTDVDGAAIFECSLPAQFIGQPFEQGKGLVIITAKLRDRADQSQDAELDVPVVSSPVTVALVPERAVVVADVPNRIYIAAATPDQKPVAHAAVEATITWPSLPKPLVRRLFTDGLGLTTLTYTPPAGQPATVKVLVSDGHGHSGTSSFTGNPTGAPGLILRTDLALAKVGDTVHVSALTPLRSGTLYLDVVRDKQTILTRAAALHNGQAHLALPLTPDMAGTIRLSAYEILPNEDIVRDTRLIVVSPADDLSVGVTADSATYRPGQEARLRFTVMDAEHRPVTAALGLAAVDESVFALSELQPGLAKVYFMLEQDLMTARYEIHGLTPQRLILPVRFQPVHPAARQLAAQMLFAAAPAVAPPAINVDTFQQRWATVRQRAADAMVVVARRIQNALQKYRQEGGAEQLPADWPALLVRKGYLQEKDVRDAWGHAYRFLNPYGQPYNRARLSNAANFSVAFLSSAGPDGKWGTADDINYVSPEGWYGGFGRGRMLAGDGFGGGVGRFGGGMGGFAGRDRLGMLREAVPAAQAGMPVPDGPAGAPGVAMNMAGPVMLQAARSAGLQEQPAGPAPPRIRQYFPETLYWNAQLVTDASGHADLTLPLADSITTWRLSMMANTAEGQLGSGTAPIRVFQDFFIDADLPLTLTQHDAVTVPVAVYNYLPSPQDITVTLKPADWFTLHGSATAHLHLDVNQVGSVSFPIVATGIGRQTLEVEARGAKLADAVRRSVDVTPDGREIQTVVNGRLTPSAQAAALAPAAGPAGSANAAVLESGSAGEVKTIGFPEDAIPGGSQLWLKIYPGAFSQVAEGLDGILRMPGGCFEQTSSSTYPDVLVLNYLKQHKQINPELQMKADGYINVGYQRLVTFEVKGGGFSWFGDAPANKVLTAYGLLEFSDMAGVHEVDPALIARTQQWLAGKQNADGSWDPDQGGIAEGIINRQKGALRTTAYVGWALAESGYKGPEVAKSLDYVRQHEGDAHDAYSLAVILNFLTVADPNGPDNGKVAHDLMALAKTTDKTAWWQDSGATFTGAEKRGADLETTGLATYALCKWGQDSGFTQKALTYLVDSKDAYGTWESTQGTVWSMKSLLYAGKNGSGGGAGTVTVLADGKPAATVKISQDQSDVMQQVSLAKFIQPGENAITLQYQGSGSPAYQIVGRAYVPWQGGPAIGGPVPQPPFRTPILSLSVAYDKTRLAKDAAAGVTVTVHNNTDATAEMPLIDIGVPPGFTVGTAGLDDAVKQHAISKYTVAARQIIVYLEKLDPMQTLTLHYQVTAKYPLRVSTPLSKAYPYYDPEQVAIVQPQQLTVVK